MPVSKKNDPNYEEVRGHVPKSLARKFKGICVVQGFDYSEALEQALDLWVQHQEQASEENQAEISPKSKRGRRQKLRDEDEES